MDRVEILRVLRNTARTVLDEPDLILEEHTPFDQIEEWDSANHLHMVVAMEKAFRIRFANAELQRLVHVSQLVDIIERRVLGAAHA